MMQTCKRIGQELWTDKGAKKMNDNMSGKQIKRYVIERTYEETQE